MCIKNVGIHDLLNRSALAGSQEVLDIHPSDELLLLRHITGINGFPVDANLTNFENRLLYRHLFSETDIINIHHASGAVFRIL